jgi:hypothetical protein
MFPRNLLTIVLALPVLVQGVNFPYENITLTDADVKGNPSIAFGSLSAPGSCPTSPSDCKVFPGDDQWPSISAWTTFNTTLGGALIKGSPPALVCYNGTYNAAECTAVKSQYYNTNWRPNDPVIIENEWLDGDSCPAQEYNNVPLLNGKFDTATATTCDVSAYPAYVVNATTVKRKIPHFYAEEAFG